MSFCMIVENLHAYNIAVLSSQQETSPTNSFRLYIPFFLYFSIFNIIFRLSNFFHIFFLFQWIKFELFCFIFLNRHFIRRNESIFRSLLRFSVILARNKNCFKNFSEFILNYGHKMKFFALILTQHKIVLKIYSVEWMSNGNWIFCLWKCEEMKILSISRKKQSLCIFMGRFFCREGIRWK